MASTVVPGTAGDDHLPLEVCAGGYRSSGAASITQLWFSSSQAGTGRP